MPVHVESSDDLEGDATSNSIASRSELGDGSSESISIGLINNIPEAAFQATERQFISLLEEASEGIDIRLSLYVLPPAKVLGCHAGDLYSSAEKLRGKQLDGLIVTGREPTTPHLKGEPYWDSFTEVVEWARENTCATVWSCLAAHAAILHLNGIERRRKMNKLVGVFECAAASDHRLTANIDSRFHIPHSRWNGVAEEDLMAGGYQVLTRTAEAEVDSFIKQENSLFVFFQGHPEYESDTLLREYRRDVGRYLQAQTGRYPATPRDYFEAGTESALADLRERAMDARSIELIAVVATALEDTKIANTWRSTAVVFYRNWLEYIREHKETNRHGGILADQPKLLTVS